MGLQILPGRPISSCSNVFSGEPELLTSGAGQAASTMRDPLHLTCVIEVPSPLVVVGLLRKHGLGDELFCLVIEVVVKIVPQQQVQEGGLPIRIMAQRGCP